MQNARCSLSLTPLLAVLLAIGCGGAPPGANTAQEDDVVLGTHVHKLPWHDSAAPISAAVPAGAHLTYYGGRVVSNVQVVQVIWGSGSYNSQVTSTASPSISTFYGGVTNSVYFDWLTEYNTNLSGGTNQSIGRGTFGGQYTITPSVTSSTVDDTQIQTEISNQISAGHLPAATTDAAGNVNTYYAVFFPHGKTITQGGSSSCVAGGFCAYHGTFTKGSQHLYYGVHPDMQAGSGCDTGCGSGTAFQNYCSVASHELIETVTDAEVGLASVVGPPLAWYDSTNGEIGDICNAQQGTVVGGDGVTYTVQKEFDNATSTCIVSKSGGGGGGGDTTLSNGVPVSNQSGASGAQAFYVLAVPAGQTTLTFQISGGSGDADMYVRFGSHPSLSTYDCRPYITGNNETCTFNNPAAGNWYVMLNGYTAYSGVTLKGTYSGGGGTGDPYLTNGVPVTGISGAQGSQQYWRLNVPASKTATFTISGGTGDADMYVRKGSRPTTSTYDCRPYINGNNETCTLTNSGTAAADYYVMLRGYLSFSGVTLKGSYP